MRPEIGYIELGIFSTEKVSIFFNKKIKFLLIGPEQSRGYRR